MFESEQFQMQITIKTEKTTKYRIICIYLSVVRGRKPEKNLFIVEALFMDLLQS